MISEVPGHRLDLRQLQAEQLEWMTTAFADGGKAHLDMHWQLLGMTEEVGEASHAVLKLRQQIRGDRERHMADLKDAVADLIVFTCGLCNVAGIDLEEALIETWNQVKQRNWVKYPGKGVESVTTTEAHIISILKKGDKYHVQRAALAGESLSFTPPKRADFRRLDADNPEAVLELVRGFFDGGVIGVVVRARRAGYSVFHPGIEVAGQRSMDKSNISEVEGQQAMLDLVEDYLSEWESHVADHPKERDYADLVARQEAEELE